MYRYNTSTKQPALVGSNGLVVRSSAWPTETGGETMDKLKTWLDKPTFAADGKVKNKHVALGVGAACAAGLLYYYRDAIF